MSGMTLLNSKVMDGLVYVWSDIAEHKGDGLVYVWNDIAEHKGDGLVYDYI